jgi:hypothetical protein
MPAGAGAEVGRDPTAAADAGVGDGATAAVRVGRWIHGGTPFGTSEEHYRMELPQPSSYWFPCGRGWHHALLQLGGETDHEAVLLLLVRVHLIRCILRQVVELLRVVVHGPSTQLEVHEILVLLPHHACWDVVGMESIAEFSPRHLVIRGVSSGVVQPPCAGITTQLLRGKEGLLHLWFSARAQTLTPSP